MAETKFESYVAGFMGLIGFRGTVGHVRLSKNYTEDLQANIMRLVRENISVVAT